MKQNRNFVLTQIQGHRTSKFKQNTSNGFFLVSQIVLRPFKGIFVKAKTG